MAVCPNKECRSTNTKYLDTRHRQESRATKKPYTYRSRVCLSCGKRFATREYSIQDLIDFGKQGYMEMIDDLIKNN